MTRTTDSLRVSPTASAAVATATAPKSAMSTTLPSANQSGLSVLCGCYRFEPTHVWGTNYMQWQRWLPGNGAKIFSFITTYFNIAKTSKLVYMFITSPPWRDRNYVYVSGHIHKVHWL